MPNKMATVSQKAKTAVYMATPDIIPYDSLYIAWFSEVMRNWQALVRTSYDSDYYYEVTYNAKHGVTTVETFKSVSSTTLYDDVSYIRGRNIA